MARLINGIFGGIKGKIGNVEGYHRFGIPLVRMEKKKTNIPPSELQKAVRFRMSIVNDFISTMTSFVAVGFSSIAEDHFFTANNAAKSYQLLHSIQGEYPNFSINYSTVKVSRGDLPPAIDPKMVALDQGIQFTWAFEQYADFYNRRAQVMMLVHCPALNKSFYTLSGARRAIGIDVLEVPLYFKGHLVEAYIAFIADDRKRTSESMYVGNINY